MARVEQHFYDWRGTPYEVGVQHGKALHREIVVECEPALDVLAKRSGQSHDQVLDRFLRRYEPSFQKFAPRAVEEIHGIADGGGFEFPYAFFAATRDGSKEEMQPREACTAVFCAPETTADGHVLLGQTKDTNRPLDRYRIMRRAYDDGLITLSLNYSGWIANIGLNSHGVANSANSLYAQPAKNDTVPFGLLRQVVAQSASVEQVRDVLNDLPLENSCMTIADARGAAICIENVAGQRDVRDVSGRAFGHANSVLCETLMPYQDAKLGSPSSPTRQRNIQRRLDETQGGISCQTMQSILADHADYPHSVCRHPAEDDPIVTTAAFIADLTALEMHVAIGNPCTAPFRTYPMRTQA